MSEEFNIFLAEAKKSPIEEKINAFGDIVEKIMSIVLRIPDLVDQSLSGINQKISTLESQMNQVKLSGGSMPTSPTPTGPSLGSGGPRPPGGPPGGPRPPGGPQPAQPARPASPVSLRGAIMGELKELFSKRHQ
ncbi:MAG: hypothetical protein KGD63_15445 [Candidatus Lokiarchaeota archaeon]|nr:hypothetical protein [Candidatus Lokiarchaeota archaeon]